MAIELNEGDPVVFWLVLGQPYAATVVTSDDGDPPILSLAVGPRTFGDVHYDASGQAPHTWCLYTDPGRPGVLPDPGQSVSSPVFLTQADADARYLTQAQADVLYEPLA